ncbi:hypothetical protein D3C78_1730520 [compost metagenome]
MEPDPALPKFTSAPFFFKRATKSGSVAMPLFLLTDSTIGTVATSPTALMSRRGSNLLLGYSDGAMASDPMLPKVMV